MKTSSSITFVHAADLHLDTPFKGLYALDRELAEQLKQATFQAFHNIVDCCLREAVDFLLIAGDIFDGAEQSLSAQLRFVEEIQRLAKAEIFVYFVGGNHDPYEAWLEELGLPETAVMFPPGEPAVATFVREGAPRVDIHGLSCREKDTGDNPAERFQRSEPPPPLSIALLHGTVGAPGPHEVYHPFRLADITGKGFDYWALGHIHQPRVVREQFPAVVYAGNPQGRDFGETGERGCFLVKLEAGQPPEMTFVPTHTVAFQKNTVDLTGVEKIGRLSAEIDRVRLPEADETASVSTLHRIVLTGRTPLHPRLTPAELAALREEINAGEAGQTVFHRVDRLEGQTVPDLDLEQLSRGNDFAGEILRTLTAGENTEDIKRIVGAVEEDLANYTVKKELAALSDEEYRHIWRRTGQKLLDHLFRNSQ